MEKQYKSIYKEADYKTVRGNSNEVYDWFEQAKNRSGKIETNGLIDSQAAIKFDNSNNGWYSIKGEIFQIDYQAFNKVNIYSDKSIELFSKSMDVVFQLWK